MGHRSVKNCLEIQGIMHPESLIKASLQVNADEIKRGPREKRNQHAVVAAVLAVAVVLMAAPLKTRKHPA